MKIREVGRLTTHDEIQGFNSPLPSIIPSPHRSSCFIRNIVWLLPVVEGRVVLTVVNYRVLLYKFPITSAGTFVPEGGARRNFFCTVPVCVISLGRRTKQETVLLQTPWTGPTTSPSSGRRQVSRQAASYPPLVVSLPPVYPSSSRTPATSLWVSTRTSVLPPHWHLSTEDNTTLYDLSHTHTMFTISQGLHNEGGKIYLLRVAID